MTDAMEAIAWLGIIFVLVATFPLWIIPYAIWRISKRPL